ncbi:hypothetical protein Tsubulata_025879, partial [Turnera subulata]
DIVATCHYESASWLLKNKLVGSPQDLRTYSFSLCGNKFSRVLGLSLSL